MLDLDLSTVKHGVLLFWAAWYTVVFLTNVLDGLKAVGVLGEGWKFASGNWVFLKETTAIYRTPVWLVAVLFGGIVVWEGLATWSMWHAFGAFGGVGHQPGLQAVYVAFAAGLAQFGAFIVADEVFISYAIAATHMRIVLLMLTSLLAIRLLPDGF